MTRISGRLGGQRMRKVEEVGRSSRKRGKKRTARYLRPNAAAYCPTVVIYGCGGFYPDPLASFQAQHRGYQDTDDHERTEDRQEKRGIDQSYEG